MFHLKGKRFGYPLIKRYGILKHSSSYPIAQNVHDGLEIHYVLKGEIAWEIEGADLPLLIPGGSFGIIPAKTYHRAFGDNGTPAERIGVIFNPCPARNTEGTPFTPEELNRMFKRLSSGGTIPRRFSTRLTAILRELSELMNMESAKNADQLLRMRILSSYLIHETYRILGEPEALAAGHDVIPQIREWIGKHLNENISIENLVKLSGYGRSRFYSLFISDTGQSPNDYILRTRVMRAKKILSSRKAPPSMTELAADCGFSSSSAFSKAFRKITGISPRDFLHQQNSERA